VYGTSDLIKPTLQNKEKSPTQKTRAKDGDGRLFGKVALRLQGIATNYNPY
jgi:hypothetical protein